jgi:glycosyltransferase involved in cell wall biosynthesis
MRIVFLAWRDTAHPQAGGSEVVIDQLASRLTERGHEVQLLHGGPSGKHNYRSTSIGGNYSQYLFAPFAFFRHCKEADAVIDVENGIPFFSPLWQRKPVIGLVHHVHTEQWGMQFPKSVAAIGRWLEGWFMPRVYRRAPFISVSPSTTRGLVDLGITPSQISTIEMGLAFDPLEPSPSTEPRFLVLSRLVPHKRVELALKMWQTVRPITGGQLVIVGDGPELNDLRSMAGPDVEFTGWVDENRKRSELAQAWLLIHPAHHEGWGTVVMEAAAASVPTLAFDVDGVRDSVTNGLTGYLATDENDFAAQWISLAANGSQRAQMATAAKNRASIFTWDRAVDMFEAVLHETVREQ